MLKKFLTFSLLVGLLAGVAVPVLAAHNGSGNEKVTVCHNGHSITIGAPAVPAHLRHGDSLGPCGGATPTEAAVATTTGTAEATPTETPTATPTGSPEVTSTDTPTVTPTDTPAGGLTTTLGANGQNGSVAVCHNGHTIDISPQAVDAHLRHGDTLGPC